MAHGDFVYWNGLWDTVERVRSSDFISPVLALAQVISLVVLQSAYLALPPPYTLSRTHRKLLRQAYDETIENLATNHVAAIIDAFGFTEYELDSALARTDQTPYEALLEGGQRGEMNQMQHLWPMMVDTRRTWKRLQEEKTELESKAKL